MADKHGRDNSGVYRRKETAKQIDTCPTKLLFHHPRGYRFDFDRNTLGYYERTGRAAASKSIPATATPLTRSCDDEAVAPMANGDAPPAWLVSACWSLASLGTGGGTAVAVERVVCLGLGGSCGGVCSGAFVGLGGAWDELELFSVLRAEEEEEEEEVAVACADVVAFVVEAGLVLVCVCCCVLLDIVVTMTPGHRAETPAPNMKTPMILVSGTSTVLQPWLTRFVIFMSPWTHFALQRAPVAKSSRVQSGIGVT